MRSVELRTLTLNTNDPMEHAVALFTKHHGQLQVCEVLADGVANNIHYAGHEDQAHTDPLRQWQIENQNGLYWYHEQVDVGQSTECALEYCEVVSVIPDSRCFRGPACQSL